MPVKKNRVRPDEAHTHKETPLSSEPSKKGWIIELHVSDEHYRFLQSYVGQLNKAAQEDPDACIVVGIADVITALIEELQSSAVLPSETV